MTDSYVMLRVVKMSSFDDVEVYAIDTHAFAIVPVDILTQLDTEFLACTDTGETDHFNRIKLYQAPDDSVWVRMKDVVRFRELNG